MSLCSDCHHPMHVGVCRRVVTDTRGDYECLCPDGLLPPVPVLTMQQLIDVGLNAFGLQLFVESVAAKKDSDRFKPFTFSYKGILVTLAPNPEEPIDGRHQ